MAYPTERLFVHCFQIELEFAVLVFVEGGKPENPEKNPRSKDENQQQTQPGPGIEPGPHWWEANTHPCSPNKMNKKPATLPVPAYGQITSHERL